ncbi:low temperature requirement protein A [Micromonospora sp. NPDC047548]|uniref:low temperature requirement protein A n=1 Tax=Micromonospora sp. NPDC047548 TaxID=3155624 RepID=UPI0033D1D784
MAGGGGGTRLSRTVGLLGLRYPGGPKLSEERHATWLELFFDLVFVLALLGVTARLDTRASPNATELAVAIVLYVLIQWSWIGQSFYDTRYDPDDTLHRLLVLAATVGAGAITLGVPQAPSGLLLPVGYLIVRGCLLLMYLRVLTAGRSAWDLVAVYLTGFGTGWLLWAGSLAISPAVRPAVWIIALAIELLTPWLGRRWLRRHPVHRTHLPERLGQFTIILLGATLTNLRDAVPTAHPPARVVAAALAAFLLPASIWWIYITYVNSRLAVPQLGSGQGYAYLHSPAGAAVLFLGWALGVVVYEIGQSRQMPLNARLVLGGSIVTWMLCGLGLHRFALGRLPRRRFIVGLAGITLAIVVTLVVTEPGLLLGLTSALLVGYAVVVSPQIAKATKGHR